MSVEVGVWCLDSSQSLFYFYFCTCDCVCVGMCMSQHEYGGKRMVCDS